MFECVFESGLINDGGTTGGSEEAAVSAIVVKVMRQRVSRGDTLNWFVGRFGLACD